MNFTESIEGRGRRSEKGHLHIANKVELELEKFLIQQQSASGDEEGKKNGTVPAAPQVLLPLQELIRFESRPQTSVEDHTVTIRIRVSASDETIASVRFFIHWGSYDELPDRWVDTAVKPEQVVRLAPGSYEVVRRLRVMRRGNYGATVFAERAIDGERLWQGRPNLDDAAFHIHSDSSTLISKLERVHTQCSSYMRDMVTTALHKKPSIDEALQGLRVLPKENDLAQVVFECSKDDENLRHSLSRLYLQARKQLREVDDPKAASQAAYVVNVLENLGLGEVVLVAPEGPHAVAGGLAHVMIGLLQTLSQHGVRVTLITPLYEYAQGNKHRSAEEVLREGVRLGDQRLQLKWQGEVQIPFGPTHQAGTSAWRDHPVKERTVVYAAESGNVRMLFLRHARYAASLYPAALRADEQLRRAIFLSRGALEVMKNPIFGVRPQLILSNDWLAALVPVFFKLDLRYSCDDSLKNAKTVHLIHNCGRDYHGRIPAQFDRADMWPMLELAPEHFHGLADPQDRRMLNLTSAAIVHLTGALLAVSKPYAEQLLTWDGGEGLHNVVSSKRGAIFGISNAIDQARLRGLVHSIGARVCEEASDSEAGRRHLGETEFLAKLPQYKRAVKLHVQRSLGLQQGEDKILLTFMGRVAEQKGIQLFNGCGSGDCISVLESILLRHPNVQFLVAGPPVDGDVAANHFRGLVEYLSWKYAGRVRGIFDFIPHEYAVELLTATDFYLMPSRYEPGGITQLEALACGAVVIARNVGGLSATLHGYGDYSDKSNSFLFDSFSSTALRDTIYYALNETRDPQRMHALMMQAARAEHDWGHRVPQYLALFQHLVGVLGTSGFYSYLDKRLPVLECMRV